jgi:hypothetical protein
VDGIVFTHAFEHAARSGNVALCVTLLERLDGEWLAPAIAALRAGSLERVQVHGGGAAIHALDRRALARWWRRAKALGAVADRL